jgi:hypothetical protein
MRLFSWVAQMRRTLLFSTCASAWTSQTAVFAFAISRTISNCKMLIGSGLFSYPVSAITRTFPSQVLRHSMGTATVRPEGLLPTTNESCQGRQRLPQLPLLAHILPRYHQ